MMGINNKGFRRRPAWYVPVNKKAAGLRHGFRSGLEEANAKLLEAKGIEVVFEQVKVEYIIPSTLHTYSVDFELPNGILVETKGKFEATDRAKHLYIQLEHPELDIRFVFQKPQDKIAKGSKTTYAMWCDKHGFKWAAKVIPDAWLAEPPPSGRPATGPRTVHVSEEAKDLFSGGPLRPQQALRKEANRKPKVARKGSRAS